MVFEEESQVKFQAKRIGVMLPQVVKKELV
jgi:hypothetical protein